MGFPIISPIIAFSLGLSCSLMPCCLPILLGYIGFLMEKREPTRLESTLIVITFASGIMGSIILIGFLFSFVGGISSQIYGWIRYIAAGMIILLGLGYLLGYEPRMPFIRSAIKEKGFKGAFLQGSVYGIGTSDCAVLMLSSLIIYSFAIPNIGINILNFIFFGTGRATPLIAISLLASDTQKRFVAFFTKYSKLFSKWLPGLLILIAGITILIFSFLGI